MFAGELPADMQGALLQQDMAGQLLQAGATYGLLRLVELCKERLLQSIELDTAVGILLVADRCHDTVRFYTIA
jgi:hypothetical protein